MTFNTDKNPVWNNTETDTTLSCMIAPTKDKELREHQKALVKHMFYQQYNREMSDQEWDIFSSGDCWNNGLIMAGAVNENEAIRIGMQDALDDAIDLWAADNIDNIYFINDETNMQEVLKFLLEIT